MKYQIMENIKIVLIVAVVLFFNACSTLVEEDLNQDTGCDTQAVSWTDDVLPILEISCLGCHNAGAAQGGIVIDSHESITAVIDRGRLLGAIRHDPGFSPMPRNAAQLSACNIEKIAAWVNDGAPNN